MMRALFILLCSTIYASGCFAEEENDVEGVVGANYATAKLISPSDKAQFFPGEQLTISVSGSVDINPNVHTECNKDWAGQCHRSTWVEHHFSPPSQAPVYFSLQTASGTGQKIEIKATGDPVSIEVPSDGAFSTAYGLYGYLAGAGSGVDPNRSVGSFKVVVTVAPFNRLAKFGEYLNSKHPEADQIINERNIVDRYMRALAGKEAASLIRQYAKSRYPVAGRKENINPHLDLLRFSQRLAPDDVDATRAIADFFVSVGRPEEAKNAYLDLIKKLNAKDDDSPAVQKPLADAYVELGKSLLSAVGSLDGSNKQEAEAMFAKAADIYRSLRYNQKVASALIQRANLLRDMRSEQGLTESIKLYQDARKYLPFSIPGDVAHTTPDGRSIILGTAYQGFVATSLSGRELDVTFADANKDLGFAAWDASRKKLLVTQGDSLQWIDPFADSRQLQFAGAAKGNWFQAANGTVLTRTLDGNENRANIVTRTGEVYPVSVSGESCKFAPVVFTPGPPLPNPMTTFGLATLSFDGNFVVLTCGNLISIQQITPKGLQSARLIDISKLDNDKRNIHEIAISSEGGYLAARVLKQRANTPVTSELLIWNVRDAKRPPSAIPLGSIPAMMPASPSGPPVFLTSLLFTPDGTQLIQGDVNGGIVRAIDPLNGNVIREFPLSDSRHSKANNSTGFNPISRIDWATAADLIIYTPFTMTISVLNIASGKLDAFAITTNDQGPNSFGVVIPRIAPGKPNDLVWLGPKELLSLNRVDRDEDGQIRISREHFSFSITPGAKLQPLSGGQLILTKDFLQPGSINIHSVDGKKTVVGAREPFDEVEAKPTPIPNVWLRIETRPEKTAVAVEVRKGPDLVRSITLPDVPFSYRDQYLARLAELRNQLQKLKFVDKTAPEMRFQIGQADLDEVIGHPDRLEFDWRLAQDEMPGNNAVTFYAMPRFTTSDGRVLIGTREPQPIRILDDLFAVLDITDDKILSNAGVTLIKLDGVLKTLSSSGSKLLGFNIALGPLSLWVRDTKSSTKSPVSSSFVADKTSAYRAAKLSPTGDKLFIFGTKGSPGVVGAGWIDIFRLDGQNVSHINCTACRTISLSELPELLHAAQIRADFVRLPSHQEAVANWLEFVATDTAMDKVALATRDYTTIIDTQTDKSIMTTQPSIPLAFTDDDVAVTKQEPHVLMIYDLKKLN